jgi:CRISPR-associated endonuclease/helicase Cas3
VSWLFCTATQPALDQSPNASGKSVFSGLTNIREILTDPDPLTLAQQLERVTIELPDANSPRESAESLAEKLWHEPRALAIVSTRRDAAELFQACRSPPHAVHLSANMCAAHREHTLNEARARLTNTDDPLLIIATNLIEAGVDISLPVVYRALAGLDSIAQAAGRCNREGELDGLGKVVVFNPPKPAPPGMLRHAQQITTDMLPDIGPNPLSPSTLRRYFERLHYRTATDAHGILKLLTPDSSQLDNIQFRSAAAAFQMIEQSTQPIITPWCQPGTDESPVYGWLAKLRTENAPRWIYRHLQRYTITVPEPLALRMQDEGYVTPESGQWLLNLKYYDPKRGLITPEETLSAENSVL